jgi:serine O-acetyltransferase
LRLLDAVTTRWADTVWPNGRPKLLTDLEVFHLRHRDQGWGSFLYYPGPRTAALIRLSQWCQRHRLRPLAYLLVMINDLTAGVWVGPRVRIGRGLFLGHSRGLVVNPNVVIGDFCSIAQQVTLGGPSTTVGHFAEINAGAIVISTETRPVRVGDFAVVGAGSVVTRDVPPFAVVVGVPARTLRQLSLEEWLSERPWYERWRADGTLEAYVAGAR